MVAIQHCYNPSHGPVSLDQLVCTQNVNIFFLSLVGSQGIGPKYLVDEYAILDTRYWVLADPCVTIVSVLEAIVMIPFCFLWYVVTPYCLLKCCFSHTGIVALSTNPGTLHCML